VSTKESETAPKDCEVPTPVVYRDHASSSLAEEKIESVETSIDSKDVFQNQRASANCSRGVKRRGFVKEENDMRSKNGKIR